MVGLRSTWQEPKFEFAKFLGENPFIGLDESFIQMLSMYVLAMLVAIQFGSSTAFIIPNRATSQTQTHSFFAGPRTQTVTTLPSTATSTTESETTTPDRVINIKPAAVARLLELKTKQSLETVYLRMGVRSGGCSGLSYVMDFINDPTVDVTGDDMIDEYDNGIKCVVDPKSMLYLYGMDLDYSDELIGGGFQFHNPNAEDSCGCGKSFGV